MRFSATLLSLALALGTASAADCYSSGGCDNCESKSNLYEAGNVLCGLLWSGTAHFNSGSAVLSISGNGFETQQRCYDGIADIIETCHGTRNGGVYDWKGAHLDVNFCSCGKVSGEVDAVLNATVNATLPVVAREEE